MASTITTASSTIMPSEMIVPSSTEMLSVKPVAWSTANMPASENGIPTPTSSAILHPRNSQHTRMTSARPCSELVCITPIARRVGTVWSSTSESESPEEACSRLCSAA